MFGLDRGIFDYFCKKNISICNDQPHFMHRKCLEHLVWHCSRCSVPRCSLCLRDIEDEFADQWVKFTIAKVIDPELCRNTWEQSSPKPYVPSSVSWYSSVRRQQHCDYLCCWQAWVWDKEMSWMSTRVHHRKKLRDSWGHDSQQETMNLFFWKPAADPR